METINLLISQETIHILNELIRDSNTDHAVLKLILKYANAKIAYYTLVDEKFHTEKGMSFHEYHDTKYDEWDGSDWRKIEDFQNWEDAVTGIKYYMELIDKWKLMNLEVK